MQKIIFIPRYLALQWQPQGSSVLISIHDPKEDRMTPQQGWKEVLYCCFDDADAAADGVTLFGRSHARAIVDFVARNKDCDTLVVHCTMGVSRSAAVAICVSEALGLPCFRDDQPHNWQSWPHYNKKVYRVLNETLMTEGFL